jgi:hypothetical protein
VRKIKKDKSLCPVRLDKTDYTRLKLKSHEYGLTFQKLVEVFVLQFLKGNKDLTKIVEKYAEEYKTSRAQKTLDQVEIDNLLSYIEQKESPLGKFNLKQLSKQIDEEEEFEMEDKEL